MRRLAALAATAALLATILLPRADAQGELSTQAIPGLYPVSRRMGNATYLKNYEHWVEMYWNTVRNRDAARKRDATQTQDTTQTQMPEFDLHLVMALTLARFELRDDATVDYEPPPKKARLGIN